MLFGVREVFRMFRRVFGVRCPRVLRATACRVRLGQRSDLAAAATARRRLLPARLISVRGAAARVRGRHVVSGSNASLERRTAQCARSF